MITQFTSRLREEMRARLGALRGIAFSWTGRKKKEREMPKAVYKSGDKEYVITAEDRLELARMVRGEGGSSPSEESMRALLWAMMNRFMLVPAQRRKTSLTEMLKAFSQPIDPEWDGIEDNQPGQDKCAPGGQYYGTDYCTPDKLARRVRMANMPWSKIPKKIRDAVVRFEGGNLPYPHKAGSQKITNWASYTGVESKFPWGVDIGGNWFFEDRYAMDEFTVAVAGTAPSALGKVIGVLTIGGIAAALGSYMANKV